MTDKKTNMQRKYLFENGRLCFEHRYLYMGLGAPSAQPSLGGDTEKPTAKSEEQKTPRAAKDVDVKALTEEIVELQREVTPLRGARDQAIKKIQSIPPLDEEQRRAMSQLDKEQRRAAEEKIAEEHLQAAKKKVAEESRKYTDTLVQKIPMLTSKIVAYIAAESEEVTKPSFMVITHIRLLADLLEERTYILRNLGYMGLQKVMTAYLENVKTESLDVTMKYLKKTYSKRAEPRHRIRMLDRYLQGDEVRAEILSKWSRQYNTPSLIHLGDTLDQQKADEMIENNAGFKHGFKYPIIIRKALRGGLPPKTLNYLRTIVPEEEPQEWIDEQRLKTGVMPDRDMLQLARTTGDYFLQDRILLALQEQNVEGRESVLVELLNDPKQKGTHSTIFRILRQMESRRGAEHARKAMLTGDVYKRRPAMNYLLQIEDAEAVTKLKALIRGDDKKLAEDLVFGIQATSDAAYDFLIDTIEDTEHVPEVVRRNATWTLADLSHPKAAEKAMQFADSSEDAIVRSAALGTLGRLKTPEAFAYLLDVIKNDPDDERKANAISSIRSMHDKWDEREMYQLLSAYYRDVKNPDLRSTALEPLFSFSLHEVNKVEAIDFWVAMLSHEDAGARAAAAGLFRHMKSEEAIPKIQKFIEEGKGEDFEFSQAIMALGDMGFPSARPWLLERYQAEQDEDQKEYYGFALADLGLSDNDAVLIEYIEGDDETLSGIALSGLVAMDTEKSRSYLLAMAEEEDKEKRIHALFRLAEKSGQAALRAVRRALIDDENEYSDDEKIGILNGMKLNSEDVAIYFVRDLLKDAANYRLSSRVEDAGIDVLGSFTSEKSTKAILRFKDRMGPETIMGALSNRTSEVVEQYYFELMLSGEDLQASRSAARYLETLWETRNLEEEIREAEASLEG
jgi:HEAT repeat protein